MGEIDILKATGLGHAELFEDALVLVHEVDGMLCR